MNELKRCTYMVVPSYESVPAVHRIGASLVFQESRSRAAAGMVHAIKMRCVRRKVLLVSSERRTATLRLRQSLLVAYRVFGDFRLLRGAHWSIAHLSGRALGHRSVGSAPHRGGIALLLYLQLDKRGVLAMHKKLLALIEKIARSKGHRPAQP